MGSSWVLLPYKVKTIKEISGNKFFCLSNHGFKIYSLNSLNEYDLISINQFEINNSIDYINNIEVSNIFEIYENKFIFSLKINYGYGYDSFMSYNSSLVLNLIELKKLDKNNNSKFIAKRKDILLCNFKDNLNFPNFGFGMNNINNNKNMILIKKKIFDTRI